MNGYARQERGVDHIVAELQILVNELQLFFVQTPAFRLKVGGQKGIPVSNGVVQVLGIHNARWNIRVHRGGQFLRQNLVLRIIIGVAVGIVVDSGECFVPGQQLAELGVLEFVNGRIRCAPRRSGIGAAIEQSCPSGCGI